MFILLRRVDQITLIAFTYHIRVSASGDSEIDALCTLGTLHTLPNIPYGSDILVGRFVPHAGIRP